MSVMTTKMHKRYKNWSFSPLWQVVKLEQWIGKKLSREIERLSCASGYITEFTGIDRHNQSFHTDTIRAFIHFTQSARPESPIKRSRCKVLNCSQSVLQLMISLDAEAHSICLISLFDSSKLSETFVIWFYKEGKAKKLNSHLLWLWWRIIARFRPFGKPYSLQHNCWKCNSIMTKICKTRYCALHASHVHL